MTKIVRYTVDSVMCAGLVTFWVKLYAQQTFVSVWELRSNRLHTVHATYSMYIGVFQRDAETRLAPRSVFNELKDIVIVIIHHHHFIWHSERRVGHANQNDLKI